MNRFSILLFLIVSFVFNLSAQIFPDILEGTWKDKNSNTYEHWDKVNEKLMKGFSYVLKDGDKIITEYLEISKSENNVIYSASVINQNNEKAIDFTLSRTDSLFTFTNPKHDFPKFIRYQVISKNQIIAKVGDNERNFTIDYQRIK